MAINIFLNRLEKDEFKEIHKVIIFLIFKKAPLTPNIIQFITHLTKFYHFNDQEIDDLFYIDARYNLNLEDTISKLSKRSSKIALFLLTLYAEIFDEIDLEDIFKDYNLYTQFPIDKRIQKDIIKNTQVYIDKTIIMHYFIYDKKLPFYAEIAHAMNLFDISKEKDQHFFIVDRKRLSELSLEEKVAALLTLKELMLDDNEISNLEKETLQLWSFYLNLDYNKLIKNSYSLTTKNIIGKQWLKNFILFSYLVTQKNYKKSIENAKKLLEISTNEAETLIENVIDYTKTVKTLFDLIFSEQLTILDESKAKNISYSLQLGELALFALPQTKLFQAIKAFNIARRAIGTPLELQNQTEMKLYTLQNGNSNNLIVVIDGFLTEGDKEQFKDWMQTLNLLYPADTIMGFKWKSQNLSKILNGGIATWYNAVHETLKASKVLSKSLIKQKEKNSSLKITLMGHSLGARVIFNTLYQLLESQTKIDTIMLFGGAVSSDKVNWSDVAHAVNTNIYNFYSLNDHILQNLYQLSMFEKPIGLTQVNIFKTKESKNLNIKNLNVTPEIDGHNSYKPKLQILLRKIHP